MKLPPHCPQNVWDNITNKNYPVLYENYMKKWTLQSVFYTKIDTLRLKKQTLQAIQFKDHSQF